MKWLHRGIDASYSNNCVFKNLNIQYALATGIKLQGSYNTVLNNTIFHIGSWFWDEGDGISLEIPLYDAGASIKLYLTDKAAQDMIDIIQNKLNARC